MIGILYNFSHIRGIRPVPNEDWEKQFIF